MFIYFHDTMANLSSELQTSLRLDRSCSAWQRSESQRNLQNLVITGNARASQSRTFLHDDSHTWGKLQPCCTIILSNLTWWHIKFHITWSKLIEELTSSIREKVLTLAHVLARKEFGRLSTSHIKMGAWSKISLASARLCSRSSCNLWIKTCDLPCCSCVETETHRKSPKHCDDIGFSGPTQALHIDCLVPRAILFHTWRCPFHVPAVQSSRDVDKTLILVSWSSYNLPRTACFAKCLSSHLSN